jgi:signal transduction histidine kinase
MPKNPLRFKLRNQLIIVMLCMLILFAGSLAYMQQVSEEMMFDLIQEEINDTMKAVEISFEQIHAKGRTDQARLRDLFKHLKKKGIEEVSIIGKEQQVELSSNPNLIGSRLSVSKNEVLIQEKIGGDDAAQSKKIYSAFVPIISRGALEGYIHISMYFQDLDKLSRKMLFERMAWTLPVIGIGLILCILIAQRYTRPIPALIEAIHSISLGRPPRLPTDLNTDIKSLSDSLNSMHNMLAAQKKLEEKLKRSEHQAMLAQLASGIAHDLRNPLNFISLSIDHLNNIDASDVGKNIPAGLITKMKAEIQRVNDMVVNFLDLGREITLNLVKLKADLPIEEVLALNHHLFLDHGIAIERAYCHPVPVAEMDIDKIKSCFQNLAVNAVDAMPDGGTLRIAMTAEGGSVHISFEDSGAGIDPKNLSKILEPYFTTKKKGVGLGLAITKRIVESHKGCISVTSTPGQGTCVRISLACAWGEKDGEMENPDCRG